MPTFIPRKTVRNWNRHDISFSIELMTSFVQGVEKQAGESVANYRAKRPNEVHLGLDGDTWDLDGIFEQYFPSLQRSSALLVLWGFLEHELDKLCLLFQKEKAFKLGVSDLSDKGIDRSTNYLEKVAGLDGLKSSPEWNHLKGLQRIRNLIAHNEGRLRDRMGNPKDGMIKNIGFLTITGNDEIVLEDGFLSNAVATCKNYFNLIGELIAGIETAKVISQPSVDA